MNLEAGREKSRRWRRNNPEKEREAARRRYRNNPEKERERKRRWNRNNLERVREYQRAWNKAHPEKSRTIHTRVRRAINKCLKRAGASPKAFRRSENLLGYTIKALEKNLKRKIPKGCVWQDYIDGKLHLDHKIPISAFNIKGAEEIAFRECWSLKNLQLLPARDNISKGAKIDGHFQAFLRIKQPLKAPSPGGLNDCNPNHEP